MTLLYNSVLSVLGHADSITSLFLSVTDPEINDEFNSTSALLGCQEISGCHTANLVNLTEEIFIEWNNQMRKRSRNSLWHWNRHGESYEWFRKEPQAYDVVFSPFICVQFLVASGRTVKLVPDIPPWLKGDGPRLAFKHTISHNRNFSRISGIVMWNSEIWSKNWSLR